MHAQTPDSTTTVQTIKVETDLQMSFEEEGRYLRSGYFEALLVVAGIVLIIPFLRAAAWRESPYIFYTWPVPAALGIGLLWTNALRAARPRMARWVFVGSLTAATALEVAHFPTGPALHFFPAIVIVAGLLMSDREALPAFGMPVLAIAILAALMPGAIVLDRAWWAGVMVAVTAFASFLGTHQLYTVLRWEWESTQKALKSTREAQDHRAELMRLNKELEGACQRLDRVNRMLVLARQEAEQARALKMQFANAVSHELRSPLNMIIGFSEMMVNSPQLYGVQPWSPRLRNHIQQIYQSAQHLSQLVDDVLDLARINAERLALIRERAYLHEVVTEAVNIMRGLYEGRKLYLKVHIDPDLPAILFDRIRIRQVLLNLLTNAVRFTEQGGVTIRVTYAENIGDRLPDHAQTENPKSRIVVCVSDTGIGIPPEDLPRLFQEFRQLDGAFFRWQRGSGLGLAISKQLIELHGGQIWAESVPGQGSAFSFTLPVDDGSPHDASAQPASHFMPASADEQFWNYWEQQARARKPVVAYAHNAHARRLLSTHLTTCDLTWAADEAEISQAARDTQPLAVVCATDRPDAFDLAVRLLDALNGTPLILCALPGLTRQALLPSISDYLVKPVSRQQLTESLSRLGIALRGCLIVEDDPAMQEFLDTAVRSAYPRCATWRAMNTQQARDTLANAQPDVVLLDLNLPDADGLDLAVEIQAGRPSLPIIVITARDYPAEPDRDEPDVFLCARRERFSQREIDKLLNGALESLSPAR